MLRELAICLFIAPSAAIALTCHTLQSGPFLEPSTWDCGCDPLQCDTLVIEHQLVLESDIAPSASIYVNGGGISGYWELRCSGVLHNSGSIAIRGLSMNYPCEFINAHLITADRVTGATSSFNNAGTINAVDSLRIFSTSHPISTGSISSEVIDMAPICRNYGLLECARLHFGTLTNQGNVICRSVGSWFNPIYNSGYFYADTLHAGNNLEIDAFGRLDCSMLTITGNVENYGILRVFGLASNGLPGAPGDLLMHAGATTEGQNYTGHAGSYLRGPGTLCIAQHSENHGIISGPISICDITPTSSILPFMDVHDGPTLLPVHQCAGTSCAAVHITVTTRFYVTIAPMPVTDWL